MRTGCGAGAAQVDDGGDLEEGEPGALPVADEPEPGEGLLVVGAVAVGCALRWGEQRCAFVEADGLGRRARGRRLLRSAWAQDMP